MSRVITLNTCAPQSLLLTHNMVTRRSIWLYLCHHRLHLHIAVKLKGKREKLCPPIASLFPPCQSERGDCAGGGGVRGPSFKKRSLMESWGIQDSCLYHSQTSAAHLLPPSRRRRACKTSQFHHGKGSNNQTPVTSHQSPKPTTLDQTFPSRGNQNGACANQSDALRASW